MDTSSLENVTGPRIIKYCYCELSSEVRWRAFVYDNSAFTGRLSASTREVSNTSSRYASATLNSRMRTFTGHQRFFARPVWHLSVVKFSGITYWLEALGQITQRPHTPILNLRTNLLLLKYYQISWYWAPNTNHSTWSNVIRARWT